MHSDVFCSTDCLADSICGSFSAIKVNLVSMRESTDELDLSGLSCGGKQIIRRVNTRGSVEALFVFAEMIYSYQRDGRRAETRRKLFSLDGLDSGSAQSPPDASGTPRN